MSAFGKETSFGLVGMSAFDPKRGGLVSDGARRHNFHYFNKDVMLSAMELLMDEQARLLDKTAIACGLLALAMGLSLFFPRSESSPAGGVLTANVGSASLQEWLVFGGLAVVIQTCARATPGGDPPSTAPIWVRATVRLLSLAIVVSLGAIGTWVAFGPGERKFSSSIPFLPAWLNEPIVFGTGRYPHMDYLNRDGGGGRTQVARPQRIIFSLTAFSTKRTSLVAPHMSAFGGKADMTFCIANVRL
ncbi:MAG: hypothetical protein WCB47_17285 [Pseudolabrys sp.]